MESVMIFQFVEILQFSKVSISPQRPLLEGLRVPPQGPQLQMYPPATFGCANMHMLATLAFPIGA